MPEEPSDLLSLLALFLVMALALSLLNAMAKLKQPKLVRHRMIVEIRCTSCDYGTQRDFKKGDYVGKMEGTCPKCGSSTAIHSIYSELPPQPQKKKV